MSSNSSTEDEILRIRKAYAEMDRRSAVVESEVSKARKEMRKKYGIKSLIEAKAELKKLPGVIERLEKESSGLRGEIEDLLMTMEQR